MIAWLSTITDDKKKFTQNVEKFSPKIFHISQQPYAVEEVVFASCQLVVTRTNQTNSKVKGKFN